MRASTETKRTYHRTCCRCGTGFKSERPRAMVCGGACSLSRCEVCGETFKFKQKSQRTCSRVCGDALAGSKRTGKRSPERIAAVRAGLLRFYKEQPARAEELAAATSRRMLVNNPASRRDVQQRITETKRRNGTLHTWPGKRGGNGEHTLPQLALHAALGCGMLEFPVKTLRAPGEGGWPSNYKVDIGFPALRLAVEVDGRGHRYRSVVEKDRLKEQRLQQLGWRVVRVSNELIRSDLPAAVLAVRRAMLGSSTTSRSTDTRPTQCTT